MISIYQKKYERKGEEEAYKEGKRGREGKGKAYREGEVRGTEVRGLKKKGSGKEKGNEKVKRSDRKCEGERTRIIQ